MTAVNQPPSIDGDGDGDSDRNGSKSALDFNSLVYIDMKKLSQSELYNLSCSSSDAFNLQNDVVPNIESNYRPTVSTATVNTTPRRIFAFSHRRHVSGDDGDGDDDVIQVTENKLIIKTLDKLVTDKQAYVSRDTAMHDSRDTAVHDSRSIAVHDSRETAVENKKRKRKRKGKGKVNNEDEFKGLGFIDVNGEVIDLKCVACDGDNAFESKLDKMTEGMVREDEFLGFLSGLEGRWGSTRRRRKYVDARVLVKVLPVGWKVLLSLRPRVRRPSLYCRRFVSPSEIHFKSCEDVAIYLKSDFATSIANPPKVDLASGVSVHRSSCPASKNGVLETDNLHNFPTHNLIKCNICRDLFTSIAELESHLQKYHGNNNQRLDMDALTRKRSAPRGLLLIREPKYPPSTIQNSAKQITAVEYKDTVTRRNELKNIPVNGIGSSNERKNDSEGNGNLKARCIWCLVEFIRQPVDAETLASSCGFICPKCKEHVSLGCESSLSELNQHADN